LERRPSLTNIMIERKGYMIMYREACNYENFEAIDILLYYGFTMNHLDFDSMGGYDMWLGNPVSIALNNSNVVLLEKLLKIGFKASCPGCLYSGTPDVCVITSVFRDISISNDSFVRILRASRSEDVVASFLKYLSTDFNPANAQEFLDAVCKTVPSISMINVSITRLNKNFVMGMVSEGILDTDNMFREVLDTMLGYTYNFFYAGAHGSIVRVGELRDCLVFLLGFGADTERNLNLSSTLVYNELSLDMKGSVYTRGSILDILVSSRENKHVTIETVVETHMCSRIHIEELFSAIEYLYNYVRSLRRQPILHKKVRGVEDKEVDILIQRFLSMDSPIFSKIVMYLI